MYNANKPTADELPTTRQLIRSTIIAFAAAIVILVTIVLPAEYAIDPTGIGRAIGLAEMGEIKSQLAAEKAADDAMDAAPATPAAPGNQSSVLGRILGAIVGTAHAQEAPTWRNEETFTLEPGASAEFKLVMDEGMRAEYEVVVEGGRVNFDLHAHGSGLSITYEKARGSTGSEGSFDATFPGEHGWFFRNRDAGPVTVTLRTRGDYTEFKAY
ncbi:putative ORF2 [Stappia sp. 22II-S9-Z10]|nr:putative ORF2 [Stappia sp. 22II-S9-Z10]